ncbi:hypothetical protein [uncultured Mucilaginibacter sp.]|uniref:hypothetical protein n=1 Tax=uncultured Mucilaginibacter sp. TaxID=797541 RepID=UPI0025F260FF|nr:hypothetical protein [uncultured Mucilaginibacter sp.]
MVIDRSTKQPIQGVFIKAALVTTRSSQLGQFEITIAHPTDSLKKIHPGYQTRFVATGK